MVEGADAEGLGLFKIVDVFEGDDGCVLRVEGVLDVCERFFEEVVAAEDEKIVVDVCFFYGELDVTDGAEAFFVRVCLIVDDGDGDF